MVLSEEFLIFASCLMSPMNRIFILGGVESLKVCSHSGRGPLKIISKVLSGKYAGIHLCHLTVTIEYGDQYFTNSLYQVRPLVARRGAAGCIAVVGFSTGTVVDSYSPQVT